MAVGLGAYRTVLADPPARAFSLAGLIARIPLSMTGLGIVLLISISSGSYARAGLVVAFMTVAAAIAAPIWGRLMDRVGQAVVLITAMIVNSIGIVGVIGTVEAGFPLATTIVAAVLVGLGGTLAGASVRARWSQRLAGTPLLNTAFAVEAMLDEVVFIVGPVLVTFLATSIHPALGLGSCLGIGAVGALLLAAQRSTQPPIGQAAVDRSDRDRISLAALLPIAAASAAIGVLFGGMEVVVVAFSQATGVLEKSGLLLLSWAAGSLVSGLVVGSIHWKASPAKRFRLGALFLALSTLPMPFVEHPGVLAICLVISGLAISPTMIASVAVAQAAVPPSRLTEAFGWTTTGLAAGVALGAAGIGRVIDTDGARGGFWCLVVSGAILILLTLLVRNKQIAPDSLGSDSLTAPDRVSPAERDTPAADPPPNEAQTPLR